MALPAPLRSAPQVDPLQGTAWQLVKIVSMDDRQGSRRPDDPSRYTLRLDRDGRASLQLDCNRAMGRWQVRPSADPGNGSFRFGPLASTKAFCPPPSLGEELGRQLTFVRGYLLRDGRLHLSLMADGGILVWEPLASGGVAYRNTADQALEAAILRAVPDVRRSHVDTGGSPTRARYVYAPVDLDGDGRPEVFVYLMGPFFCGTGGCNLLLLRPTPRGGYALVSDFPTSRVPIFVSERRTRGWRDLWRLQSGGGAPATYVRQVFDGRRYVERERIPAGGAAPAGTPVLSGELTLRDGAPLEPSLRAPERSP
jgi:heat shock protein HslJ